MIACIAPEYFPRIQYCAMMLGADVFAIADTRQYSRQSFQNRTKLRTPNGWQWLTVPLKGGQHGRAICDVEIDRSKLWQTKQLRGLAYNYRSSPYFEYYEDQIIEVIDREWVSLGELTVASVALLHKLLGAKSRLVVASQIDRRPETTADLMRAAGEAQLVNLTEPGCQLPPIDNSVHVIRCEPEPYRQVFNGFEAGMSMLDLLFNYGREACSMMESWTRQS